VEASCGNSSRAGSGTHDGKGGIIAWYDSREPSFDVTTVFVHDSAPAAQSVPTNCQEPVKAVLEKRGAWPAKVVGV
jgi:hypothetical protein